jgi:hypothetical protein
MLVTRSLVSRFVPIDRCDEHLTTIAADPCVAIAGHGVRL